MQYFSDIILSHNIQKCSILSKRNKEKGNSLGIEERYQLVASCIASLAAET